MTNVCFYFQVHQPFRMRKYRFFDIGRSDEYFDHDLNKEVCKRLAKDCYLPANEIILEKIRDSDGRLKVSFSISGLAIEQFEQYAPEVIDSFKKLAETGCVEFLGETYYHSLASAFSEKEFDLQVKMHSEKINALFGQKPKVFRNTELIYDNDVAAFAERAGFTGILSEGADSVLGWRSPNSIYKPKGTTNISLIMKNYRLSDDIAFRFSDKEWSQWPLTADKFSEWVASSGDNDDTHSINLFMDYETFGEHHKKDSGIMGFLADLPGKLISRDVGFITPSELISSYEPKVEIDVPTPISWADDERDMSAWKSNNMQNNALSEIFDMEDLVKSSGDARLIQAWRMLTTSDHFYYMSTKKRNDGMIHNYFSPYKTPYDSFISYMNIVNDMSKRLGRDVKKQGTGSPPGNPGSSSLGSMDMVN